MAAQFDTHPSTTKPCVALIDGRLYGYGETHDACRADFRAQIAGAVGSMRARLRDRVSYHTVTDDHASEVAEMLAADVLEWT